MAQIKGWKQKHRQLAIGTPMGEDVFILASCDVVSELGRLPEIEVTMASERHDISSADLLGQNATVRMELGDKQTRHFNGYFMRFRQVAHEGGLAYYKGTLVPWLWFLTQYADCRIFQNQTVPDIVATVFRDRGFSDFEERLSGNYRQWEYCVQYRETEFDFVSRLMELEGIYYYFTHDDGKHTMVLADSPSAHQPFPNHERIEFHHPERAGRDSEYMTEWTAVAEIQPGVYAHTDFDFKRPKADISANSNINADHPRGEGEVFDYPGQYVERSDGEEYAKRRIEELHARRVLYRGETQARGVETGAVFSLFNTPNGQYDLEYLVVASNIHMESDIGEDPEHDEAVVKNVLQAIESDKQFRPRRTTPKPRIPGPQTAIVVGKKGEEIDVDEFGRVKVHFPWDRYGSYDEKSSCRVRVAQSWASKKWGTIFIPRIGQEVVVDFLEGDPDRPIITGCVYNGEAMPPYDLPANATRSTVKTNTSKGGAGFNEIRFEDKKGQEQIFVHAQRNMDVRVGNDQFETVANNRHLRVGGEDGGDQYTYVANDVHELYDGGEFRKVAKERHETVEENVFEYYKDNQYTFVENRLTVGTDEFVLQGTNLISAISNLVQVQGSRGVHLVGSVVNIDGTRAINLKATNVNIEGTAGVSLKVGGNFVVLDPSGVSLNGVMVKINSGGSAKSAASAERPSQVAGKGLILPTEASPADSDKPGEVTTASGEGGTRQTVTPAVQTVEPFEPPAPPPPPPPPPPPTTSVAGGDEAVGTEDGAAGAAVVPVVAPQSEEACGIANLKVVCQHGREAGPTRVLQIVPDGVSQDVYTNDGPPAKVTVTKVGGGQESVTAQVESVDGNPGGKKELASTSSSGAPGAADWKMVPKEAFNWLSPDCGQEFPVRAAPDKYYVHGRGCDDVSQMVLVEVYPSDAFQASVSLDFFEEVVETINGAWEDWGKKVFKALPIDLKPQLTGPSGKLEAGWGWKEDVDWQAYFEMKAEASLAPVFGISLEIEVSAMQIAGAKFGIPTAVTKLLSEHVADILLVGGVGFEASLTGVASRRLYPQGQEYGEGSITLSSQGFAEISLTGRAGSKWVAQVSVTGSARIEVNGSGSLEFERKGLFFSTRCDLDPLIFGYVVKTRSFWWRDKTKEGHWKVWDTINVWQMRPRKLLPRN